MRHAILTLLLCATGFCARSQTFQRAFCTGSNTYSFSVGGQQTSDGGFVTVGGVMDTNTFNQYWHLTRLDASGAITQEQTFNNGGFNLGWHCLQQTTDNGFVVADFDNIVKTDANLNVQWSKSFGNPNVGNYGSTIWQTSDGGYVFSSDIFPSTIFLHTLAKLDGGGNVEWSKLYDAGNVNLREMSTRQTMDGGFIITGISDTGLYTNIFVMKTDSLGNVSWSKELAGADDDQAMDVVQLPTGEYVLSGTTKSSGAGLADFFLAKLDANGNVLWAKTYGGSADDWGNNLVVASDGGFVLAGYTESFGAAGDIMMIKTDASGTLQWSKHYGGSGFEGEGRAAGCLSLSKVNGGGYFISTYTNSASCVVSSYVLCTDSLGNTGCSAYEGNAAVSSAAATFQSLTLPVSLVGQITVSALATNIIPMTSTWTSCFISSVEDASKENSVSLFPNPADRVLHVAMTVPGEKRVELRDLTGQLVWQGAITVAGEVLLPELAAGMYVAEIYCNGVLVSAEKLVIAH